MDQSTQEKTGLPYLPQTAPEVEARYNELALKNKILYGVAGAIILSTFTCIGIIIYWVLAPNMILTIKEPLKVLNPNKIVENGDVLVLEADFCKQSDTVGNVTITLIGKSITLLQQFREAEAKGCKNIPVKIPLPIVTNFETRKIHYVVTYEQNPLKTVTKVFESEEFNIATKSGSVKQN